MPDHVSRTRTVDAPPEEIFEILARPANHALLDGSGSVKSVLGGADRLTGTGDAFWMRMRIGVPYMVRNTVTEFEEGRRIAWRHVTRHTWRYELEPTGDGTRVTETFDPSTSPLPLAYYRLFGFPEDYATALERTLENLATVVEGTAA